MSATPDDLLAALAYEEHLPFPRAALEEIVRRKGEMTPYLLEVLADCHKFPDEFLEGQTVLLPTYAAYLLAQFRESRAFPLLIALLHLSSEELEEMWADSLTEDMGNILASVYDGNLPLLMDLLENPAADESARSSAALGAYLTLFASGRMTAAEVEQYFWELLEHKLERTPSYVWDSLAGAAGDLGFVSLLPLVRKAFDEGLCDPCYDEFEAIERRAMKGGTSGWKDCHQPLGDAIAEMKNWHCFARPGKMPGVLDLPPLHTGKSPMIPWPPVSRPPVVPVRAEPVTGRNEPCPCGSGKKFKKCCGA